MQKFFIVNALRLGVDIQKRNQRLKITFSIAGRMNWLKLHEKCLMPAIV